MPTTSTTGSAPALAAVSFALWANAVLDGRTSLDEAAAEIGGGRMHRITRLPGESDPVPLTVALGRLRASGAGAYCIALPVPGDPLGLIGPRAYTEAAVAAGQAVVVPHLRLGLVPTSPGGELGSTVHWETWAGLSEWPPVETVPAAARALREAVLGAADALAELDAPTTPGAEPSPRRRHVSTPPGLDPRTHDLLARAERLLAAIQAALGDPSVSTSATLDARRRSALLPVERAARRALVAACQPALAELPRR